MTEALITATHHGWDHGPWPFPFLFIGFWLLVVVAAVVFVRRGGGPRRSGEAVLAERYARGDITDEEYRARRDVLRSKG
jgi:uncharacterized membrane protein